MATCAHQINVDDFDRPQDVFEYCNRLLRLDRVFAHIKNRCVSDIPSGNCMLQLKETFA
jgi:hypothetical protein